MKPRAFIVSAVLGWMGLIFLASSLPGTATGPNTLFWHLLRKGLHFLNFGILSVLLLALLKGDRLMARVRPRVFLFCLLMTVSYAISDELHQKFTPGRHPSAADVAIDAIGAGVFLGTSFALRRGRREKKQLLR